VSFFGNVGIGEAASRELAKGCNLFYIITDTGRNWT